MSLENIEIRQTYLLNKWVIAKISKRDPNLCNQQKNIDDKILIAIATEQLKAEFEKGNSELEIPLDDGILLVKMEKKEKSTEVSQ